MIGNNFRHFFTYISMSLMLLITALILGISCCPDKANAEINESGLINAINRAGQQRMLTQRMLKSYCQLGQDQFYIQPDKKLQEALNHFEQGLEFLKEFEQIVGVKNSLSKINAIWPKYKTIILEPAIKGNVPELIQMNENLLTLSHQIVLDLETIASGELAKVVNVSGRLSMLSQRIELFYLLRNWGFNDDFYVTELAKAREQFASVLDYLNAYKGNTDEIKTLLSDAGKSFRLLNHSLDKDDSAFFISLTIRQLLKYMDEATNLYSKM